VPEPVSPEVSELLAQWGAGDRDALRALIPLLYQDLHHMAHRHLRKARPGHTLQTTAPVNEAYLRLEQSGAVFTLTADLRLVTRIQLTWHSSSRTRVAANSCIQVRGPACGSMVPETCFVDERSSGRISVAKLDSYGPDLFGAFSARIQV